MRNFIITIFLVLINFACKAQSGIQYVFPSKVEQELNKYIEKYHQKEAGKAFYIVFDKLGNKEYLISVLSIDTNSTQKTDSLLKKTNRFVQIGVNKLPILFMTDTDFLFLGRDDRGRLKRRTVMYHGYEIFFTYDGEIIKKN